MLPEIIVCKVSYWVQSETESGISQTRTFKGTISDKKNLQITLDMKKITFQSQHVPFSQKNAKCEI